MTIAAGFICSDGVLLASDTLYSNTGMGLKYGPKFWVLDHGDVLVVFGGAGMEAAMLRTRDEIDRKLKAGMSLIRVVDLIDDSLKKVHGKLPNQLEFRTAALVVVRAEGRTVLYENAGASDMLSPIQQACQCVGYGQSLGWYFASSLFGAGMSLKWAKRVAAHLVKNCKDYSESCGGQTHLIEVPNHGAATRIEDQTVIADYEQYFAEIESATRIVVPDGIVSEHTLEQRVIRMNEVIRNLRTSQFIVIPAIASTASLQGRAPTMAIGTTRSASDPALGPTAPPSQADPTDDPSGQPPSRE